MQPIFSEFQRRFSMSTYKNLKISLSEMTFSKDFVQSIGGDLYPIIEKSGDCDESIRENRLLVKNGFAKRLFCSFFPFATYELTAKIGNGEVGFCFAMPSCNAYIGVLENKLVYTCAEDRRDLKLPEILTEFTMCVSCRPGAFDVYFVKNEKPEFFCTLEADGFLESNRYDAFSKSYVYLFVSGDVTAKKVSSYIDSGVAIADLRPLKYENGDAMYEGGKLYLSATVRMQAGMFQGVFAWTPTTNDFAMTGAMFYDAGDGVWRGYVAPALLYHREEKAWYLWASSYGHKHILAHARFEGDPRFGVSVIDVSFMPEAQAGDDVTAFVGFKGDEDPDFFYDKEEDRWLMAICRIMPKKGYSYLFFTSQNPFEGYTYLGRGEDGAETGGSFVRIDGALFFVCGAGGPSEYRIYSKDGMEKARFHYPDGGFRGWGSVFPVKMGSRTRLFWLTFDRHRGSDYNWSYGNVYCFEAESKSIF